MTDIISALREQLHSKDQTASWSCKLCHLLQNSYCTDLTKHLDIIIPYCYQHQHIFPQPLRKVVSMQSLRWWVQVAPFASFDLDLQGIYLTKETARQISTAPHLKNVRGLKISRSQLGKRGYLETIIHSHFLQQVVSLDLSYNLLTTEEICSILEAACLHELKALDLSGNMLNEKEPFFIDYLKPLKHLHHFALRALGRHKIGPKVVEALTSLEAFTQLTYLDLGNHQLGDTEVAIIANSDTSMSLINLVLSDNQIGDEGAKAIAESSRLSSLRHLMLNNNHLTPKGLIELSRSNNFNLQTLNLNTNTLFLDEDEEICISSSFEALEELSLRSSQLGVWGAELLGRMQPLEKLTTLDLSNNRLTDRGIEAIADAGYMKNVKTLRLARNELTCNSATMILSKCNTQIQELDLSGNQIEDKGISEFFISHIKSLSRFIGADNQLTSKSVQMMIQSDAASSIQELNLSGNDLGRDGIELLLTTDRLCKLDVLRLRGVGLDDEDLAHLARSSSLRELSILDLSHNHITSSGIQSLIDARCTSKMKQLILRRTPLGKEGLIALSKGYFPTLARLEISYQEQDNMDGIKALANSCQFPSLDELFLHSLNTKASAEIACSVTLPLKVRVYHLQIISFEDLLRISKNDQVEQPESYSNKEKLLNAVWENRKKLAQT